MKKINTLNFSVSSDTSKKHHKGIIPFLLLIIIAGMVSVVFILTKNNFDIKKVLGLREEETSTIETTTSEETHTSSELDFTESVNFLTVCYDENNSISFSFIFSFIPEDLRLRIKPIDPDMNITLFTGETTFQKAFKSVSIDRLIEGLNNKNIPIDRYVLLSEDDFISVIQILGSVSIVLDTDFEYYSNSIKYVCPAGLYEFTSDALLAYMKYQGTGDSKFVFSANGAKTIIETFFTDENISAGESLFTKLINCVNTDITVFDYISAKPSIEKLNKKGFSITINL